MSLPSRPIIVLTVCVAATCSYIFGEVHIMVQHRLQRQARTYVRATPLVRCRVNNSGFRKAHATHVIGCSTTQHFLCYILRLTLLLWAGGQSSSRTPNVTPAGGFFSKGFRMIPAMPILQAPLSRGGLESSDRVNTHKLAL